MDIDLSQYMGMYIDGSKENLDLMDKMLLSLENDPGNIEAVGEIFRAAHTLKGMSATMGFEKVAHLTHEMENILDKLRNKQFSVTTEIVDVLFETFDVLRVLVNDTIASNDSNIDVNIVIGKLHALTGAPAKTSSSEKETSSGHSSSGYGGSAAEADTTKSIDKLDFPLNEYEIQVLKEAKKQNLSVFLLFVSLAPDCLLKAPRAFMIVKNLEEIGCDIIKSVPDTKDLEQEKFELSFSMILVTPGKAENVKQVIEQISEIESVEVTPLALESLKPSSGSPSRPSMGSSSDSGSSRAQSLQSSSQRLPSKPAAQASGGGSSAHADTMPQSPSSGGIAGKSSGSSSTPVSSPGAAVALSAAADPSKKVQSTEKKGNQTVRVDMRRLDELMNLVGELVINRTRLADIGAAHRLKDLNEALTRISQISLSLQNVVMQVRMVPIEQVFDRFPRMVRDLSKKLNKKIDLILEGKETEMDRTVIDEIGDPMVHLIRNSIDHGIEEPAERVSKGKSETGTITLTARHEGNHVIIEVRDDGKGIDPKIVGASAVRKGLFTQEQIDRMPVEEITKIIFLPGFSTNTVVSDISGRGVGMDAVKTKLDELGGQLDIESKVGEGSRVFIKLPLTLAILQALMVKLGNETYAIPLGSVQETMDITSADINIVQHQEVTLLRGEVLPIIRLRNYLDVPKIPDEKEKTEEISIVVCSSGEKRAGFMVDELLGQQEIVIKSLGNLLGGLPGLMGATMRGDGSIALILDIPAFLQTRW
ncbi:MAG: chemotaxis protein CheA [Candidatus Riflebacteria bacterium]|nr:chemotaxis protein CheA [Candidatus Riflebacteria bacterium]